MSVGVNVVLNLLRTARLPWATTTTWKSSPTTAKGAPAPPCLGEVVADALGRDLKECVVYGREVSPASAPAVGFETIRAGDVVGPPCCLPPKAGIEITHTSRN